MSVHRIDKRTELIRTSPREYRAFTGGGATITGHNRWWIVRRDGEWVRDPPSIVGGPTIAQAKDALASHDARVARRSAEQAARAAAPGVEVERTCTACRSTFEHDGVDRLPGPLCPSCLCVARGETLVEWASTPLASLPDTLFVEDTSTGDAPRLGAHLHPTSREEPVAVAASWPSLARLLPEHRFDGSFLVGGRLVYRFTRLA